MIRLKRPFESTPRASRKGEARPDIPSLEQQYHQANNMLLRQHETMAPPSIPEENLLQMEEEELQLRFPARYERYREMIRVEKRGGWPTPEEQRSAMAWFYMMNSFDHFIEHNKNTDAAEGEKRLYEKQLDVFEAIREHLEKGFDRGYVKLPTGFGKTVLFAKILEAINQPAPEGMPEDLREATAAKALVVVPTIDLIDQTFDSLGEFAPDLDVGTISSHRRKRYGNNVTVITYYSFQNKVKSGEIKPADFDMIILDEVHEATSAGNEATVREFLGESVVLGFSAAPEYHEEKTAESFLEHEIYSMSINEAVGHGLLCEYTADVHHTNIDISDVQILKGEYDPAELEKAIDFVARAQEALKLYEQDYAGMQIYLFCESVTAARITAEVFAKGGVTSAVITSKFMEQYDSTGDVVEPPAGETIPRKRKRLWDQFTEGSVKAFSNVDMFTRGSDNKVASVAFNLAPTLSKVRAIQRGGRVLRVDPANPEKHAHVIDFLYTDRHKKKQPVTFAQVARGDELLSEEGRAGTGGGEGSDSGIGPGLEDLELLGLQSDSELIESEVILADVESPFGEGTLENDRWELERTRVLEAVQGAEWMEMVVYTSPDLHNKYITVLERKLEEARQASTADNVIGELIADLQEATQALSKLQSNTRQVDRRARVMGTMETIQDMTSLASELEDLQLDSEALIYEIVDTAAEKYDIDIIQLIADVEANDEKEEPDQAA